jgi:hypothetical protein
VDLLPQWKANPDPIIDEVAKAVEGEDLFRAFLLASVVEE